MKKYHLRRLILNNSKVYFSYSTNLTEWEDPEAVMRWARCLPMKKPEHIHHLRSQIFETDMSDIRIDVIISDMTETEAKAAKKTAIIMAKLERYIVLNKR